MVRAPTPPIVYGYARISRPNQNIERQIRNIKDYYADAVIIKEIYTRRKMSRPQWDKLYKALHPGDTVIFDSVSRMAGDADAGYAIYQELFLKGINLVFLKEHEIDTDTYKNASRHKIGLSINSGDTAADTLIRTVIDALNEYILALARQQIYFAFKQSEKEVHDLRQRTREGIATARLEGKQIGRMPGRHYETSSGRKVLTCIQTYSKDFGGSLDDTDVIKLAGCARNTYYKYKKALKDRNHEEISLSNHKEANCI